MKKTNAVAGENDNNNNQKINNKKIIQKLRRKYYEIYREKVYQTRYY